MALVSYYRAPVLPSNHPRERFCDCYSRALFIVPLQWFKDAGFEDVQIKRIGPSWYRGVRRHGLIMGCSVTGTKSKVGCVWCCCCGSL